MVVRSMAKKRSPLSLLRFISSVSFIVRLRIYEGHIFES